MRESGKQRGCVGRLALSIALSLLFHATVVLMLLLIPMQMLRPGTNGEEANKRAKTRHVRLEIAAAELPPDDSRRPFAKTDPNQEEKAPKQADFIGSRDTTASASEFAPKRRADAPLPTQNGEETNDEIVTFDQSAQEGDLSHERLATTASTATPHRLQSPPLPTPPAQPQPPTPPSPETSDSSDQKDQKAAPGVLATKESPRDVEGDLRTRITEPPPNATGDDESDSQRRHFQVSVPVFDPALAQHAQQAQKPGFRTRERRTRSTGNFVLGRKPSLNVASTPLGRYEEEIYRRIAYYWYKACDDHRGDIIPGSIMVSLRINTRGLLETMDLVRRRGASVSQQSFTFGAIRQATLPPMPNTVREEIVGDLLELIFTFNFD